MKGLNVLSCLNYMISRIGLALGIFKGSSYFLLDQHFIVL
jgi:hypothetical protein